MGCVHADGGNPSHVCAACAEPGQRFRFVTDKVPGAELDLLVAEHVMGYVWRRSSATGRRCIYALGCEPEWMRERATGTEPLVGDWNNGREFVPAFSSDDALAWTVIDALPPRAFLRLSHLDNRNVVGRKFPTPWECILASEDGGRVQGLGVTRAHALCLAALQYHGVIEPVPAPTTRPDPLRARGYDDACARGGEPD